MAEQKQNIRIVEFPEADGSTWKTERASATPLQVLRPAFEKVVPAAQNPTTLAANSLGSLSLRSLQEWFYCVITDPDDVSAGIARAAQKLRLRERLGEARLVTKGPRLSENERLGIYHYAYHARLVECLRDDFPIVCRTIGEDAFEALARGYMESHPPRHPNLNAFGRDFPRFCAAQAHGDRIPLFVAELARLEWMIVEAIHAPSGARITLADLEQIGPEAWASARLCKRPCVFVDEFQYPVNAHLRSVREGGTPGVPEPAWSATAVVRDDLTIWRMDLSRPMWTVLSKLFAGQKLADALAPLCGDEDVGSWFRTWMEAGLFERVEFQIP